MDIIFEFFRFCGPFILENWSFILVAFLLGLIGEVVKAIIFNGGSYPAHRGTWRYVFRKFLPILPVITGGMLGIPLASLAPPFVGSKIVGSILYFAGAGVSASWGYNVFKKIMPEIIEALTRRIKRL